MNIYKKENIAKGVNRSKAGGGGGGLPEGRYLVRITGAQIRQSKSFNSGFSFQLQCRDDREEFDGKEVRLEYWHHVDFNMDNFLGFMEALGFDFDRIEQYNEENDDEWTHKHWIKTKVFREIEDGNVKFYIDVTPQKKDKKRMDIRPDLETIPKLWDGEAIPMDEATADAVKRRKEAEKDGDDDDRAV
jgi:hypothetical protein